MLSGKRLQKLLLIKLFVAILRLIRNYGCDKIDYSEFRTIANDVAMNCDVDVNIDELLSFLQQHKVVRLGTNDDVHIYINDFDNMSDEIKGKYNGSFARTYIQLSGSTSGMSELKELIRQVAEECWN